MKPEGSLIIISAPSGTGKTSLVTAVCKELKDIRKSISHTTREIRSGEESGVHYNFVTIGQFDSILRDGAFLEHAEVFGNFYGTSREWVLDTLKQGIDVILEIDWQGAAQIRKKIPSAISIFILPPSSKVLRDRLVGRNKDHPEKIEIRLAQAKVEVSHYNEYDYLIVNDDFDLALRQLIGIIAAARLRVAQQKQVWQPLIDDLIKP
ncbi:MAG TPA: guanylate kinase [Gammaproteobacteria bacterium]|nr:guanylate kinase [Gammaproteobacteria bacterium]